MIGKLTGRVDYVADDHALIEASGVGYIVHCAPATLARLAPGETAALYTDLVVREDLMQLFGFASLAERDWHKLLCSVQGVGARVSLAILGALGPDGVGRALALEDAAAVKRAPGVGPKLAARIVNELKGKAPEPMLRRAVGSSPSVVETEGPAPVPVEPASPAGNAEAEADAVSALVNLGYEKSEALRAVMGASASDTPAEASELIRRALKALAPQA